MDCIAAASTSSMPLPLGWALQSMPLRSSLSLATSAGRMGRHASFHRCVKMPFPVE